MKKIILFALLGVGLNVHAQQIVTEAPSVSSSAVTVPDGQFQLEMTFIGEAVLNEVDKYRYFSLPSTLFRYGLMDNLEMRVTATPYLKRYESSFFEATELDLRDLGLGLKYAFMKDKNLPTQVALIGHFNFPYVRDLLDGDPAVVNFTSSKVVAAASHNLSNFHSIGFNLIGNFSRYSSSSFDYKTRSNTEQFSLIYNFAGIDRLNLFAEIFGGLNQSKNIVNGMEFDPTKSSFIGIDGGAMYLIQENIQLDMAAGYSVTNYKDSEAKTKLLFISLGIDYLI